MHPHCTEKGIAHNQNLPPLELAGAAQPKSKIALGGLIRDIFLGGPIDGAAAASNAATSSVSEIALVAPLMEQLIT